jgi:hypothetical protein
MVMMAERPTAPIPLSQAIAELDSPEAIANRRKRAKEWAKKVTGHDRGQLISTASREALQLALSPRNKYGFTQPTEAEKREIERQVTANMDALVERMAAESLRRSDEAELYRDPRRLCEQRVWGCYTSQVSAKAWQQGSGSDAWIARWSAMIAERAELEEFGDSTTSVDARLLRHVGVPFPAMPLAAWEAADMLPATERQDEYDRLTALYGPREPVATDAPKRRGRK